MPSVSVVMPVYNGEKFLRAAIDSILDQTFHDFEFIIVNDGSRDQTPAILVSYTDHRIRLFTSDRNMGIVESLNRGIAAARGTFICRMDADDVAVPNRIERQVTYLNQHPDIALLGTFTTLIDCTGSIVGTEEYPSTTEQIRKAIFVHNPFAHGTVMVRRSILEAVGLYDGRFLHNEDYDLWLRITAHHRAANLPEWLLQRRLHPESITSEQELELVRYRFRTLAHAIFRYERKPYLSYRLVRPLVAYWYRRVKGLLL